MDWLLIPIPPNQRMRDGGSLQDNLGRDLAVSPAAEMSNDIPRPVQGGQLSGNSRCFIYSTALAADPAAGRQASMITR